MNNEIDFEQIFYRYNPWWEGRFELSNVINRESILNKLKESLPSSKIIMLTGLRRIGKTTLMKCMIKHLLDINIDPKYIFYISLDDYLLSNQNLLEIIDNYRAFKKIAFDEKIYLFLDEIANQKDFEIQLKNIYDQGHAKVYASSSSASILKNKKAFLTGRNTVIEVLPLDFEEYLIFKKIDIKKSNSNLLKTYFEDFIQKGGIPEYVLTDDIEYLKELVDDIIQKDIANFYGVKDTHLLKDFFLLLMERSGKIMSINKIAKILDISPDSAKRYLEMFKNTYLIYVVQRTGKTNERLLSAKKVYASDLG
ncbi:MAG: ATP-binding protein, partial [Candidatus Pacebacteria bacterium]|nr:ATP-binding protein [Candidatus Paceibacterota bacterium]